MATFQDLQTRIADELDNPNIGPQIQKAIVSAVAFYERRPFYFTETSFTFNTVVGQEYYTATDNPAIATAPNIERLNILFSSIRMPMTKREFEWIDDISALPIALGVPENWAYRAEQIRVYPIPSQVWTITAYDVPRLTMLSNGTDSNAWTDPQGGEELIRTHAKIDLLLNVIRGTDMEAEIALLRDQEQRALAALYAETASRKGTGVLTPMAF